LLARFGEEAVTPLQAARMIIDLDDGHNYTTPTLRMTEWMSIAAFARAVLKAPHDYACGLQGQHGPGRCEHLTCQVSPCDYWLDKEMKA
jgi:hypothetical protein